MERITHSNNAPAANERLQRGPVVAGHKQDARRSSVWMRITTLLHWIHWKGRHRQEHQGPASDMHRRQPDHADLPVNSVARHAMRRFVLGRLKQLGLSTPFSWDDYLAVLQREAAVAGVLLEVRRAELGQGHFGEWFVTARGDITQMSLPRKRTRVHASTQYSCQTLTSRAYVPLQCACLVLPLHVDGEHLDWIAFHELGHLELGHLAELSPTSGAPGSSSLYSCVDAESTSRERDAELFATTIMRLSRGWDPGATMAPSRDSFFDVLT